ncbi:MAG: hypothetical protein K0U63_09705, partial [Cyanobacteria bacterium]|nr:hypothetical protein [Cyanobacteriota bacterium]
MLFAFGFVGRVQGEHEAFGPLGQEGLLILLALAMPIEVTAVHIYPAPAAKGVGQAQPLAAGLPGLGQPVAEV